MTVPLPATMKNRSIETIGLMLNFSFLNMSIIPIAKREMQTTATANGCNSFKKSLLVFQVVTFIKENAFSNSVCTTSANFFSSFTIPHPIVLQPSKNRSFWTKYFLFFIKYGISVSASAIIICQVLPPKHLVMVSFDFLLSHLYH